MKTLRRFDVKRSCYFITCCTHERKNILHEDIDLFWECWDDNDPVAWVILHDHFHMIIENRDSSISDIMRHVKIIYSRRFRDRYRENRIWQNRFWDHIIRNETDYNNHLDYIHYNPVKHGYSNDPFVFPHSSLNEYYRNGFYTRDWGVNEVLKFDGQFGE